MSHKSRTLALWKEDVIWGIVTQQTYVTLPHTHLSLSLSPHASTTTWFRECVECRKQKAVDETVAALRSKGLDVQGCACHVGSADQRKAMIQAAVKVRGASYINPP